MSRFCLKRNDKSELLKVSSDWKITDHCFFGPCLSNLIMFTSALQALDTECNPVSHQPFLTHPHGSGHQLSINTCFEGPLSRTTCKQHTRAAANPIEATRQLSGARPLLKTFPPHTQERVHFAMLKRGNRSSQVSHARGVRPPCGKCCTHEDFKRMWQLGMRREIC